jgi:uridine kinase
VDRQALLVDLAKRIADVSLTHPTRVAIDGVDAAGKTTLADALVAPIEELGRPVIRATVDGFHRPREERYRRGSDSPEGYYHDSFDYDSARGELLEQLGPGGSLRYRTATFAFPTDQFIYERLQTAQPDAILLFDGIFLMRPELNDLWDFRIFLEIGFEESLERAGRRNAEGMDSEEALRERYEKRYIPGQRLYLDSSKPREIADVVVEGEGYLTL